MQFGKPNRPSTPIGGVISNYYGETAVHDLEERYHAQAEFVTFTHIKGIEKAKQRATLAKGHQGF